MPDNAHEFLRGLRLVRDADNKVSLYGPDGDHVIYVVGNLGLDLSAYQIGSWVAAACHEYAARRREQTHSAECWRLPGHEACARGLLKRWWPVIEAAREYAAARWRHETKGDFDGSNQQSMEAAAKRVADTVMYMLFSPLLVEEERDD